MISILIIVKNDREIESTLESLKKVKKPEKTEIIVVDASNKETLLDIKKNFPKVRWIYYKNKADKKITIPEQRNLAIKVSKGRIIVFIDAGCVADKDWLIKLIRPIKEDDENFVAGLVRSKGKKSFHDRNWIQRKNINYLHECGAANTAFKREILEKVGIFDRKFNYGSDVDFSWRVVRAGYNIRYVNNAIIYISWGSFKQDIKRSYRYGEARANLYKKHKYNRNYLLNYKKDLFTLYCALFFIYLSSILPISIFIPEYSLFILIPFIRDIRNNPFKKMAFNFFYGYGFIKRLIEVIFKIKK